MTKIIFTILPPSRVDIGKQRWKITNMSPLTICIAVILSVACADKPLALGIGILGPSYSHHAGSGIAQNPLNHARSAFSYSVSNINNPNGIVKHHTEVNKDELGGRSIRHSSQESLTDPLSGQTDVRHDQHAFHINPFYGHATVHTNNAQGFLNPSVGHAAFEQKTHDSEIAPGHTALADTVDTAAVSPVGSAANQAVHAASTDLVHGGIAHNSHTAQKSHSKLLGVGEAAHASSATKHSFDGEGYGSLQYQTQAANQAYDKFGQAAVNEAGYKLNSAYDARVNLGSSNEVQYSRHAAHDPYGNYGAVTQARQAAQGGQLVPTYATAYYKHPTAYYNHPTAVVYKQPAYVPDAVVAAHPSGYYY